MSVLGLTKAGPDKSTTEFLEALAKTIDASGIEPHAVARGVAKIARACFKYIGRERTVANNRQIGGCVTNVTSLVANGVLCEAVLAGE